MNQEEQGNKKTRKQENKKTRKHEFIKTVKYMQKSNQKGELRKQKKRK